MMINVESTGVAVDGGAPMSSRKDFAILMYQGVELKGKMNGASTVRRQRLRGGHNQIPKIMLE